MAGQLTIIGGGVMGLTPARFACRILDVAAKDAAFLHSWTATA